MKRATVAHIAPHSDLLEANRIAFVSTVHVADDPNGEGFGISHYVSAADKRLGSSTLACPYGPSPTCAIDTTKPFEARFTFAASDQPFGYAVSLHQEGRAANVPSAVRYVSKPAKGSVPSAAHANELLSAALSEGMTLVVSYWAGAKVGEMSWLDAPCTHDEETQWHCTDAWTEQREQYRWTCERRASAPPYCGQSVTLSHMVVCDTGVLCSPDVRLGLCAAALLALVGLVGLIYWQWHSLGALFGLRVARQIVPVRDPDCDEEDTRPHARPKASNGGRAGTGDKVGKAARGVGGKAGKAGRGATKGVQVGFGAGGGSRRR